MQTTHVQTEAYVPDREFARNLFNEIFGSSNPTPQEHLRRLREEEAQGRSAIKIVNLQEKWQRDINRDRLQLEGDPSHDQRLMENFRRELETIVADRFSPASAKAFKKLKRLTRYHEYEKRDGGFLQRAMTTEGLIISGDKLCQRVMEHYA
jgi:hypothetical protein